jgi:NADPH2:quinone reductase
VRALLVEEFGGPRKLVLRSLPSPRPGDGEVLVAVAAIGVNFPDVLVIGGRYQFLPPRPFSPGKELAGTVVEAGAGVERLRPGDRVLAHVEHGAYRDSVVIAERLCSILPEDMSFEDAAVLPLCGLTAHFALKRRARVRFGETVLVTGAGGGVGLAGVQLAKSLGARVIAVASTPGKRALALEHGADVALDADAEQLRERVRDVTGERWADVVLENVGGELFDACLRSLAWQGRMIVVGFASGAIPAVRASYVLVKNISVLGLQVSDYRDREPEAWLRAQEELLGLWRAGRLRLPVRHVYRLEDAAEALEAIAGRRVCGRAVLTTGGEHA